MPTLGNPLAWLHLAVISRRADLRRALLEETLPSHGHAGSRLSAIAAAGEISPSSFAAYESPRMRGVVFPEPYRGLLGTRGTNVRRCAGWFFDPPSEQQ